MMSKVWKFLAFVSAMLFIVFSTENAHAMHIMEGFLPPAWAAFWFVLCIPFWLFGVRSLAKVAAADPRSKMLLAFAGAFSFVLSALKLPSVTGSSSHPTGVGLGTIIFGPTIMAVLGTIVLLFQALLLAHGGLTTLGANTFSMAILGPLVAYVIFAAGKKVGMPRGIVVFLAAMLADLATYVTTALQLALAFPDPLGGITASLLKFLTVFAITQVPLAVGEGLLTVLVFNLLTSSGKEADFHEFDF